MFCPNCGAKVTETEKFCSSCGTALMTDTEKKNPEIKQVQEHHEIKAQPSAQQENKEKSKVDVNQLFSMFIAGTIFLAIVFFILSHLFGKVPIIHTQGPLSFFNSCLYGAMVSAIYTVGEYIFGEK